ncbi:myb-binding protein 1a isoform 4 [Lynx pardinus]|uniref:Myb-binding protein 1a isoform 4 n=1 Tax=Lynx pardinus TaxID=191816 RepID=A0A485NA23_LYNPA|nr:myb-binding protein 1a isoform 4 [Lynx pardinus]
MLLQSFEDIPLCSILQQIQEKHDLQKVKKATMRPALFANLFGVLALFQSGRLVKDSEALMKSVKLLQTLAQHHNHLHEQPQKALVDILSEVPEATLQEILPKVLRADLNSVLGSPEHLELFLLARQKVPRKLEELVGPVSLFSDENVPRLVTGERTEDGRRPRAAASVKKERKLPAVALDLLRLALQEGKFPRFWKDVVEQGLLKKQSWPASYLCFRLLGAALPLLSAEQLPLVMRGDLIRHFGEHMVTAKLPNQFKFAPEMNEYAGAFLEGCRADPERQLAVVVAFTSVTNQGLPVLPTFWRAVRFLSPPALKGYVAWLRTMFLQPDLDSLVDFSTSNQKKAQDASLHVPERAVSRLRKWLILRLVSIVDTLHVEKEEDVIEEVARFCFFHSFFEAKKPTSQIPETEQRFSFPLESRTREVVGSAFFSLLQTLSTQCRQAPEQTQDSQPWTYRLVRFADSLLNHSRNVAALTPFTAQQRQAWDRMLQSVRELEATSSGAGAKAAAFQHLLLLVGIYLFKVLNPEKNADEDSVVVTDGSEEQVEGAEDRSSDGEDDRASAGEDDSGEDSDGDSEEEDRDADVDQGFREQLMAVLRAGKGKALGAVDGEDDDDDGDELGDEAMMALDQNLASLFAEQKLRIQARKDEKDKLRKEKVLRRDFQIRVLDLIEVLVTKQPESPLVLELLEPLLDVIRRSMRTSSTKQEQDLLHKTARIFTHHLCRSRHYCHDVGRLVGTLYAQVERLVQQAGRQADAAVSLYYFNAALYLLRVLKGNAAGKPVCKAPKKEKAGSQPKGPEAAGGLDLSLVTPIYSSALTSFLTRRNSPLTVTMFLSLFSRHPVLCKSLLPVVIQHVTGPARPRHQAQACLLLQKALPTRELRVCFDDPEWEQLVSQILAKVTENLRTLGEAQTKSEHQKELSSLGLLNTLFRTIHQEKLTVDLTAVLGVLQSKQPSLQQRECAAGSSRLYDLYWQAMKALGVQRPKSAKKEAKEVPSVTQNPVSTKRKKKGFLPETKKRKKPKSEGPAQEEGARPAAAGEQQPPSIGKKRRNRRKATVPAPAPAAAITGPGTPAKTPKLKKKRKLSQVNGAAPVSPVEPAGKKQPQKDLPEKGVSGKSPQSALPRKKARLSLASRSPSLLQSGAKRKKAQLRKVYSFIYKRNIFGFSLKTLRFTISSSKK